MKDYIELLKALKSYKESLFTLHHNVVGVNFFPDHEKLGEYYDKVSDIADDLIEIGRAIDIVEPSISESIKAYAVIEIKPRTGVESFRIVQDLFNVLIDGVDELTDENELPYDITSKLQEYQSWFRKEADYKLANLLQGV